MNWDLYLNFLIATLAIINPIAIIPLWSELTSDVSYKVRLRLALMVIGLGIISLIIFLVGGKFILKFFSIDLMVFKVAGGILLLITGIKMIEGSNTKLQNTDDEEGSPLQLAKVRFQKIFVPMVIPIIVGPGSITTVILFGAGLSSIIDYTLLAFVLTGTLGVLFILLVSARWFEFKVDPIFFTAITRLFGIIVTAIAIQFMLEGLGEVFPNWVNQTSPIIDEKTNVSGSVKGQ
jgi:multiple antibiotic resistance protein